VWDRRGIPSRLGTSTGGVLARSQRSQLRHGEQAARDRDHVRFGPSRWVKEGRQFSEETSRIGHQACVFV
jgi:hypothetical protein